MYICFFTRFALYTSLNIAFKHFNVFKEFPPARHSDRSHKTLLATQKANPLIMFNRISCELRSLWLGRTDPTEFKPGA